MTDGAPKKPTLFFAHPAGTYGTQAERVALRYLGKLHPNHRIINPGSPDYKGSEKSSNLIAKASDTSRWPTARSRRTWRKQSPPR